MPPNLGRSWVLGACAQQPHITVGKGPQEEGVTSRGVGPVSLHECSAGARVPRGSVSRPHVGHCPRWNGGTAHHSTELQCPPCPPARGTHKSHASPCSRPPMPTACGSTCHLLTRWMAAMDLEFSSSECCSACGDTPGGRRLAHRRHAGFSEHGSYNQGCGVHPKCGVTRASASALRLCA